MEYRTRTRTISRHGVGLILGDGALSYDGERILETYYKFAIADGVNVTADYQFVDNPGYNLARPCTDKLPVIVRMPTAS